MQEWQEDQENGEGCVNSVFPGAALSCLGVLLRSLGRWELSVEEKFLDYK